jgi:hypothetical protein
MLCHATLACAMLGHTTLRSALRRHTILGHDMLRGSATPRHAMLCSAALHDALARLSTVARALRSSSVFECGPCFNVCDLGACAGLDSSAMACAQPTAWASASSTRTQAQQAQQARQAWSFLLPRGVNPIRQQLIFHLLSLVLCGPGARLNWARLG